MDEKTFKELIRIYQKAKSGYKLTPLEKELLKTFFYFSIREKINFSDQVNESVDDIEIFIEKDIKRN